MDSADLRVFEAVARYGSMNRAAAALHTVQSNVTARIRNLEGDLGCRLFDRRPSGVVLTRAGQRLLPYARRIESLIADAGRAAGDDGTPSGQLIVGSLETTAAIRLSPALARFAATYPAVDLVLRTGTTCELIEQVLKRELDAAFVCGPVRRPELEEQATFQEELALLTALGSASPLEGPSDARIIVLRAGCSYRQRLEDLLIRRGIPVPRIMEFGTIETIIACVAAGLGITLLPRALLAPLRAAGRVSAHELPPDEAMVDTVLIRRREAFRPSGLNALIDCIGNLHAGPCPTLHSPPPA
jgi:LysR family transcriptional regulator, cell division regulator